MTQILKSPLFRSLLMLVACIPLLGINSFEGLFAPKKDAWDLWQAHDPDSAIQVDHGPWNEILGQYLHEGRDGINRFDYKGLKRDGMDKLDGYLQALQEVPVSRLNRSRQLAYWINLYNAQTVHTVASAYPVAGISDIDISPGLFSDGPWGKPLLKVEGQALTLNDIEHRIIRPLWDEPRVHYALNCASIGCPNLARRAYTAEELEPMLETAAIAFVRSPRALWWENGRLQVSSIYAWFQDDFGGDDAGILAHLILYAEPETRRRLEKMERIDGHDYDWRLNGWHE